MYSPFDWIRRCRDGAELLATLRYVNSDKRQAPRDASAEIGGTQERVRSQRIPPAPLSAPLGAPPSALDGPCLRCWVYARVNDQYCATCQTILDDAWGLYALARRAVVIWGYVTELPKPLRADASASRALGLYIHDAQRFLLILHYRELQPWLRELALYHGGDLRGLIQICPPTTGKDSTMGEILCRIIHDEARLAMNRLWVRFFAAPHYVFHPRYYEREGVLTFEASEFLRMLDMATVFRTMLPPHEQKILYKLLTADDDATGEAQFYWGRLLGLLNQEAKDMLSAWKIRQWSKSQVSLLYTLVRYVEFYQSG